jgi:N-acetylmuramoyl-L-alanine amidase
MAKLVAIGAGHGGYGVTPGKRTPDGEYEWDFNNKVVVAAIAKLKANGVKVIRLDDPTGRTDVPLKTRTDKANAAGADVYVSVHHNANTGRWGSWTGTETFTYLGSNPGSEKLAREVQPRIVKAYGLRDRGMKKENFHVVRESNMPAILTEGGYMDSTIDIKKMRDDNVLKAAGEAIAEGVLAYFGLSSSKAPVYATEKENKPAAKPSGKGKQDTNSITEYLKSIGVDASFSHREKLAKQYGISGYKGTASQNLELLDKMRSGAKPASRPSSKGDMKTNSITEYLQSIGVNSSFSNREKLAKQYGISGYKGTASQNLDLLNKMRKGAAPAPAKKGDMKTNSITEYLQSIGVNSSFSNREKLAKQYGISGYKGTASQNTTLLNKMRGGSAPAAKRGDQKTNSLVDYLKSINVSSSFSNREKLAKQYGVKGYKGTAAQNVELLNKMRG